MKLTEIKKQQDLLKSLTDEQVNAILELIDLKTEQDMEKALQKMETVKNDLIKWLIGTIIAAAGLIVGILKF